MGWSTSSMQPNQVFMLRTLVGMDGKLSMPCAQHHRQPAPAPMAASVEIALSSKCTLQITWPWWPLDFKLSKHHSHCDPVLLGFTLDSSQQCPSLSLNGSDADVISVFTEDQLEAHDGYPCVLRSFCPFLR